MQIVAHPRIEEYDRIFEIVEKFATGENLYVRQHATVPLIELARRRFATIDANTRFMSDELARGRFRATAADHFKVILNLNHYAGHAPATIKQFQDLWRTKGLPEIRKPQPIKKEASLFD